MAVYNNFECTLSLPECDPEKLDERRKKLHALIDGSAFNGVIEDLKANAAHATSGPKPKSVNGEVRVYAEAGSHGEARVGVSVGIRF